MSGLVGIIANDSARYSLFASCMHKLRHPPETDLEWFIGGDWCGARNTLVEVALDRNMDWLWFMDDDHAFPPDLLMKLLRHDLPLVMPVCLTRIAPFVPVQYVEREGEIGYLPIPLDTPDYPKDGLVELEAGGCAGMLIRMEVIHGILEMDPDRPLFEHTDRSEDIIFCEKARAAGFPIHADLTARLGHITTAVVWPAVTNDEWCVGINVGRDLELHVAYDQMMSSTTKHEEP